MSRLQPKGLLVVLAAGAVALGGAALASSAGTVIHGCVNSKTRVLSIPRSGKKCGHGTTSISWDQAGPRGVPGLQGIQGTSGPAGFSASASDSRNPSTPVTLNTNGTDTVLLSGTIRLSQSARVEAAGGGTFSFTPGGGGGAEELDCGLKIDGAPMGNRVQSEYPTTTVSFVEPGSAGGAAVEPAGSHTVTFGCHNIVLTGSPTVGFEHGDLNVLAAAP